MPLSLGPSRRDADPISETTKRLEQNPRDVLALRERAEAFLERRDARSALRDVERCLQIVLMEHGVDSDARSALLATLYVLQSRILFVLDEPSKAMASAERALQERPDDVNALAYRGRLYFEAGDMRAALADIDRAIQLDGRLAWSYVIRAMIRYEFGDYQSAIADCDQAIQIDQTYCVAWSERGHAYLALNQLQRAESDFQSALRLQLRMVFPYAGLASVARLRGRFGEALTVIKRGLTLYPNEPMLLVEAARIHLGQNRLSEAQAALEAVLQQFPANAEALALRGQIHGRSSNFEKAMQDLSRAVELDPCNTETLFNHSLAQFYAGHPGEALFAVSRVLQLKPGDAEAQAWRAKLVQEMGFERLDEAARVLEHFAYSHCGPGRMWRVGLREMYHFAPHEEPQKYNAAVLDLCQSPPALIEVVPTRDQYVVKIMTELRLPGSPRTTFSEIVNETISGQPALLLQWLDRFLDEGILVVSGEQLRYHGKASSIFS